MRPARAVVVYTGPGAGARSALSAIAALNAALGPATTVTTVTRPAALASTDWHAGTAAIVFPGGADSPYARDLAGAPNASVRAFCEAGGAYIGLCAGAYYGCAAIDFEPGTPLAVAGGRELRFFGGRALGAAVPGFAYETEAGAAAVQLRWRRHDGVGGWRTAKDYCNGGPIFVGDPQKDEGRLPDDDADAGVTVLARYAGMEAGEASSPAVAAAAAGGAAALRCTVGAGVAVLCGTHPELTPARRWLEGGGAPPDLVDALEAGEEGRAAFWEALLAAAGLL